MRPHANCRSSLRRRRFLGWSEARPLEPRIAPAVAGTLSVAGTTLVYASGAPGDVVTLSGSDRALTITDSAGTIRSTVPGLTAAGCAVTGTVPSYVRTIALDLAGDGALLSIGAALTSARNLILNAQTVESTAPVTARNVTESGQALVLSAAVSTTGAAPLGGDAVFNGPVVVQGAGGVAINTHAARDGNVVFAGPVSGTASLSVNAGTGGNITAAGPVTLGGAAGLTLTGNNLALGPVVDGGATTLAAQNAVTLGGGLTSAGPVAIAANQDGAGPEGFTQTAGGILTTYGGSLLTPGVSILVNTPSGGSGNATVRGITVGFNGVADINTKGTTGGPAPNNTVGGAIVGAPGAGTNATNVVGGTLNLAAGPGGITLTTAVTKVAPVVSSGALAGNIALSSRGVPVVVSGMQTTNGSITVTSDDGMTASATAAGDLTLTTTAGDVALNTITSSDPAATLTIHSAGAIAPTVVGIVAVANVRLTAASGIGSAFLPLDLGTGPYAQATLTASTDAGGIAVTSAAPLVADQVTANAGDISLSTFPSGDLNVAGDVGTAAGGAVTVSAAGDLRLAGGTLSSDTGPIVLAPTANLAIDAPAIITTGDPAAAAVTIEPAAQNTVLAIAGTIAAAAGGVTIDGSGGSLSTTLDVTGTIRSGGALAVAVAGTGTTLLTLAGTLGAAGDTTLAFAGPTVLAVPGALTAAGNILIGGAAGANPSALDVSGTIQAAGNVTIGGSPTAGSTVVDNEGAITSTGASLTIQGGTTGTFTLTNRGSLAGAAVTVRGSSGSGRNTLVLGGQVAATGAAGITVSGGTAADTMDIIGTVAAPAGGTTFTGAGNYAYAVTPSAASAFTFAGTGSGTLQVNAPAGSIAAATADFTGPITFTANRFRPWTRTAGVLTVTPTAP